MALANKELKSCISTHKAINQTRLEKQYNLSPWSHWPVRRDMSILTFQILINHKMFNLLCFIADPSKRMNGAYGYIGYLGVIGLSVCVALQLLGVI